MTVSEPSLPMMTATVPEVTLAGTSTLTGQLLPVRTRRVESSDLDRGISGIGSVTALPVLCAFFTTLEGRST